MAIEYRICLYCGKEWRTGTMDLNRYCSTGCWADDRNKADPPLQQPKNRQPMRAVSVALLLALVPRGARADVCSEAVPVLISDRVPCDGVLVPPLKLGELLKARELRAVCAVELEAERKRSVIDRRSCDERVTIMAGAVDAANARADRFPWAHVLGGILVGLAAGAVGVGMLAR